MKDWRECKKITLEYRPAKIEGTIYQMQKWDFKPCCRCAVEKCRGKILVRAEGRAMKAISKAIR